MRKPLLRIKKVEYWPLDIPLTDPFVVATGSRVVAEIVFVRITLTGGIQGYGEAAPLPEVGGESRASCLTALRELGRTLLGLSADSFTSISHQMKELSPNHAAARCALETALLDAFCHSMNQPMWELWGRGDLRERETDITIPICDQEKTLALAHAWHSKGFRLFKMKVGNDVDEDVRRLEAVQRQLPGITFIGDGNQGFSVNECIAFAKGVARFGGKMLLLEQPVARDDLDGLAAIRRETGVPVAADESVRSLADAKQVVECRAADYLNIKIMKTGVVEAREIAAFALAAGLKLMVGGMVETRIAMGCSFGLVLGMKGFSVLDLDTPLLLAKDPVNGGYHYCGPRLQPWIGHGLGLSAEPNDSMIIIE